MDSANAIDVLMPTYNSVRYLEAALKSLKGAIPNCRLVAVDHHSHDGTLQVLNKYRARVYLDDGSLGHARQLLFEKSTSPIVLMLDSDVVLEEKGWYPKAVRLLGKTTREGKTIGAVALLPNINPPAELEKYKRFWWRLLPSLRRDFFVTHSTLLLRESVKGIQIPDRLGATEDIYIWLYMSRRGYVSRTMGVAGTHYFTLSHKKGRWMGANLRILQSFVRKDALRFIVANVVLYPFLALLVSAFTFDLHVLTYNLRRWLSYLVGYASPAQYLQIDRG